MREVTATELLKFAKYFNASVYCLLDLTEAEEMNDVRKRMKEKTFSGNSEEIVVTNKKAI